MIPNFTKIYNVLEKESNQFGKLLLEAEMSPKACYNFLFNYKVGNCFAEVLKQLIIIEFFKLNYHAFFNIHHSSVLKCLGSNGMTVNTLTGLIHYMSILIHCHGLHFKFDIILYIRFRKFNLA